MGSSTSSFPFQAAKHEALFLIWLSRKFKKTEKQIDSKHEHVKRGKLVFLGLAFMVILLKRLLTLISSEMKELGTIFFSDQWP